MASLDNKNNNSELSDEEITEAYFGELPWE